MPRFQPGTGRLPGPDRTVIDAALTPAQRDSRSNPSSWFETERDAGPGSWTPGGFPRAAAVEEAMVQEYMQINGCTESQARAVFMYLPILLEQINGALPGGGCSAIWPVPAVLPKTAGPMAN